MQTISSIIIKAAQPKIVMIRGDTLWSLICMHQGAALKIQGTGNFFKTSFTFEFAIVWTVYRQWAEQTLSVSKWSNRYPTLVFVSIKKQKWRPIFTSTRNLVTFYFIKFQSALFKSTSPKHTVCKAEQETLLVEGGTQSFQITLSYSHVRQH